MATTTVPTKQETAAPEKGEEVRPVSPPVDIFELENELAVVADMPGVSKEDIDVRVDNGILTISAQSKMEMPGEALSREFEWRHYYRQFELGREIDQDKIAADYKHGVLTVRLPKAESAKPKRISVNVS